MYLHYHHLPEFDSHEAHTALMDAMICNDHHRVYDLLMENSDHAELLVDAFLSPTLMWMAEHSRSDMFEIWKEFGYGMQTYLLDPESQELMLPLLHWSTIALPLERLNELSDFEGFQWNPWEIERIHPESAVFLPGVVFGILRGDDLHRDYWLQKWVEKYTLEQKKIGPRYPYAKSSIKILLDGLVGLEKVEGVQEHQRFVKVLNILDSVLFSNPLERYQALLKNTWELETITLKRLMTYWLEKDPTLYTLQENWSDSLEKYASWQVAIETGLPLSSAHLRGFLLNFNTLDERTSMFEKTWDTWIAQNPSNTALQNLSPLFKDKQGHVLSGRLMLKTLLSNKESSAKKKTMIEQILLSTIDAPPPLSSKPLRL